MVNDEAFDGVEPAENLIAVFFEQCRSQALSRGTHYGPSET